MATETSREIILDFKGQAKLQKPLRWLSFEQDHHLGYCGLEGAFGHYRGSPEQCLPLRFSICQLLQLSAMARRSSNAGVMSCEGMDSPRRLLPHPVQAAPLPPIRPPLKGTDKRSDEWSNCPTMLRHLDCLGSEEAPVAFRFSLRPTGTVCLSNECK